MIISPLNSEETEETVDVLVEKRVLLPGDYLVHILRTTYEIPDHIIFNEYLNFIKELNPDIKDINTIGDYQIVLIPLNLPPKNKKYKIIIMQPESVGVTITTVPVQETPPPPPPKPLSDVPLEKVNITKLLQEDFSILLAESGSTLQQEGIHEFPDFEGSQLSLNTAAYPILHLANNTTIIIDTDNLLPLDIREVIQSNWNNYKIVPSGKDQRLQSILNQLIKEMGFFKVIERGDPLVRGQNVLCKISGDWMIFPDSALQKVFVINLVHTPDHKAPMSIRVYLGEMAIHLIDIDLFEQVEGEDSFMAEDGGMDTEASEITRIDFIDKLAFIDTLLILAGQEYSKNVPISVYRRDSTGLALEITIDRIFSKDEKKHLIYLQNNSPKLLHLLTKQGFPLLKITPEEDSVTTIKKVLDFIGVSYQSPIITFAACTVKQGNKIWINIPGIFFTAKDEKAFLTHLDLHQSLTSFLGKKGITLTIYK
jgi:hypothetical protein